MTAILRDRRNGFSLVEVVTALGIAAFCLLTLLGLLAVGVTSNKGTINQSIAVNIASAVAADLRATPLATQSYTGSGYTLYSPRFRFVLPGSGMQTVYVSDQGTPLTTVGANLPAGTASYRVTIQGPARPSGTSQRFASPIYILVTWPGGADPTAASWPKNYTGSFQVVTYLDQN
jgi:uncharacterized protein (TIGR02598 family)